MIFCSPFGRGPERSGPSSFSGCARIPFWQWLNWGKTVEATPAQVPAEVHSGLTNAKRLGLRNLFGALSSLNSRFVRESWGVKSNKNCPPSSANARQNIFLAPPHAATSGRFSTVSSGILPAAKAFLASKILMPASFSSAPTFSAARR